MTTESVYTWAAPPIVFGVGAVDECGHHVARLGPRRVALVTDPGVVAAGVVERVERSLIAAGVDSDRFEDVSIEPTDESAARAVAWARDHPVDGYVAVGGGSVIDTAKVMDLLSTNPGELADYLNPPIGKGIAPTQPLLPLVAVPTTAGTGAESTAVCVFDILALKLKTGVSHPMIRPRLAIVDPSVTLSLPPEVTASGGMDVLCHALESFTAVPFDRRPRSPVPADRPAYNGANPISDLWAREALRLLGTWFRRAHTHPDDLAAREGMMRAATWAGIGFGNAGVHLPHACAYPVAGMVRDWHAPGYPGHEPLVPHGLSVVLTAPACFRFTWEADPGRHEEAASLLAGGPVGSGPDALPDVIRSLCDDLGLPTGLRAVSYREEDVPALAAGAIRQQRLLAVSPRPVAEDDLAAIIRASL
jgi:alcohol dehydrogenase class IV